MEIIPQDDTSLVAECPRCAENGMMGPVGFRMQCAYCLGHGRVNANASSKSPIVNICSSGFVAALEHRHPECFTTALRALELHVTILDALRQPIPCLMCDATGKDTDPFRDDDNADCDNCKGSGKVIPIPYANLIGSISFDLLKGLAADLRAALNTTTGGQIEQP